MPLIHVSDHVPARAISLVGKAWAVSFHCRQRLDSRGSAVAHELNDEAHTHTKKISFFFYCTCDKMLAVISHRQRHTRIELY